LNFSTVVALAVVLAFAFRPRLTCSRFWSPRVS
jgi:hypothetical protein